MSEIRMLAQRLRSASISCVALTRTCLDGIQRLQPILNAFITVTDEQALSTARELDSELRAGRDRGLLHGIPIVYKDCIDTAGVRTTIGSSVFRQRIPRHDAVLVKRFSAAGAVMLGKNNMNELAAGGPGGYNKFYGSTRNPWNLEHESGGSSSGTGATVAAGLCPAGIGTDSGGSIRGPSAHMGTVGLRPTVGRTDLSGVFPRAPSLDTCGPIAASALDARILFNVMTGSASLPPDDVSPALHGLRLGSIETYWPESVQDDVAAAVRAALKTFERLGARIVALEAPEFTEQATLAQATRILVYEFAREFGGTYHAVADPQALGPIVHSDMAKAGEISASAYEAAMQYKRRYSARLREAMQSVDALVTPTMSTSAPLATQPDLSGAHRRFTIPVSLAGLPALSIPCGLDASGLPIGLQLVGAPFKEDKLLAIARAYETATHYLRARPGHFFDLAAAL